MGLGDPFFGSDGTEAITKYCLKCTVRKECGDKGDRIDAPNGIWGGKRRGK